MFNPDQPALFPVQTALDAIAANDAVVHRSEYVIRNRDKFYRSTGWLRARAAVFARDGARCAIDGRTCADAPRLDVDHVIPRFVRPDLGLVLSNLQVLCSDCHRAKTYRDALRYGPMRDSRAELMRMVLAR